ncbi:MAG: hypothetical protein KDD02_18175 [Phaeodactylibacter sp.]|nr:hypothetical protein [Phaeodactylibacter sp.]MCB9303744.1 hypothetical protein [Lewinellaceae bacterium]HQU60218.1 hypothetical protein [Saprospiraceae bacterium]
MPVLENKNSKEKKIGGNCLDNPIGFFSFAGNLFCPFDSKKKNFLIQQAN